MSEESPQYQAFRAFARGEMRADKAELKLELWKELRAEFQEMLTRSASQVIEGPPGKNGIDGKDGANGKDGRDGVDGKPGERGADGIGTQEDLRAAAQEIFADFQVRTLADLYKGVYKPGETYDRSALVTWGGSLFLALANTANRPEQSPDWKLIVKHGADAKR